jgi:DNA topoisomerase IA
MPPDFTATCITAKGTKLGGTDAHGRSIPPSFPTAAAAQAVQQACVTAPWSVLQAVSKDVELRPYPPYITSTIQQSASVTMGMSPAETMKHLQALFEGGHITYHRTDSTAISPEGIAAARAYVGQHYPHALPKQAQTYASKSATAQEAHEAIRPTHVEHGPEGHDVPQGPQATIYRMLWQRFVACQMTNGVDARTTIIVAAGSPDQPIATFRATGSVPRVPGWRELVATAGEDESPKAKRKRGQAVDSAEDEEDDSATLPPVSSGAALRHVSSAIARKQTKPPPRFSQASLIKELENRGVGRPSTYASILTSILDKNYISDAKNRLSATQLGLSLSGFLERAYAQDFIELAYTADMEAKLDRIAAGEIPWMPTVREAAERLLQMAKAHGFRAGTLEEASRDQGPSAAAAVTFPAPDPQRLRPCNQCGAPTGWCQLNPDGTAHACGQPPGGPVYRIPSKTGPCRSCGALIGYAMVNPDGTSHRCASAAPRKTAAPAKAGGRSRAAAASGGAKRGKGAKAGDDGGFTKPCTRCGATIILRKTDQGWSATNEDQTTHRCR